jgi:hypothetical protein
VAGKNVIFGSKKPKSDRLLDYIHLNPVRAGLVAGKDGMESYAWSSLPVQRQLKMVFGDN